MNYLNRSKQTLCLSLALWAAFVAGVTAHADASDAHYERLDSIAIWPDRIADPEADAATIKNVGVFQNVTSPTMIAYLPPKEIATGTSLLICPGGGYSGLAWLHHVERLAPLFTSKGIAVIGLKYRTSHADNKIPEDAVADFNQAIRLIRKNADAWNLEPDQIVGLGFSAGSNLLLQYACTPGGEEIKYLNFLCLWPFFREAESYSIQKQDLDVILFTTEEDKIAPASFSVEMTEIFNQSGGRAKLIKHPQGNHLAFNFEHSGPTVDWTEDFLKWLAVRGLLDRKSANVDGVEVGRTFRYGVHDLKWVEDTNGNRLMDDGEVEWLTNGQWQTMDQAAFKNTVLRRRTVMYLPNGYVYKKTPTRDLAAYISFPEDWQPTDKRPAMLWFFGGAWSTGNPSAFKPQADYFAKRGVVGICADYRIATVDGNDRNDYRAALDAKTALRWVRKNAEALGIDPDRIMVGGDSAGGHVAAATQIASLNDPNDDLSISTQASALLLHNPYVVRISEESWLFQMDFSTLPPVWISYGLLDAAAYSDNPDSPQAARNGESFIAELGSAGIPLRTYIKEGMNHGFCSGPHLDASTRDIDQFLQECGLLISPDAELSDEVSRYPFILQQQAVDAGKVERSRPKLLEFPVKANR